MTPGNTKRLPRARARWLLTGTLLGALGGAALAARKPPLYRAVCVLDYGEEPLNAAAGAPRSAAHSQEWYRTQDIVLASHTLAERVVQELRLDRDRSFAAAHTPRDPEAARSVIAGELQTRLSITPVPQTHAVRVAIDDTDPKRAARIANALAAAYLTKAVEDRVAAAQRALAWIEDQIGGTGRRLAEAEFELQTYLERQEGTGVAPEQRQEMLTDEIKRLTNALTDTRFSRIELSARLAKLKAATQTDNPFDAHAQEIDSSDAVKQLRSAYLALVIEDQGPAANAAGDASQPLGPKKLDALWGRMQSTLDGIVRGAQGELTSVQQVETQLQNALERANAAGHALQRQQLDYVRLNRTRSEAEQSLQALRERSSAVGVATAAGALNARIIDPASPPPSPLWPPYFLYGAALGAAAGLLLSSLLLLTIARLRRPALLDRPQAAPQPPPAQQSAE